MKNILLVLFILLVFNSCDNKRTQGLFVWEIEKDTSIFQLGDSSFLSNYVPDIEFLNSEYFVVDAFNHRVIRLDSSLNFIQSMGQKGRAPGDLLSPNMIFQTGDSMAIIDANRRINYYKIKGGKYEYRNSLKINDKLLLPKGIFLKDNLIYSNSYRENRLPYSIFNYLNSTKEFFGEETVFQHSRGIESIMLKGNNGFYALNISCPVIEKYTFDQVLLKRKSYNDLQFLESTLRIQKEFYKKSSNRDIITIVNDACLCKDKLYVLIALKDDNGVSCEKIMVINCKNLEPLGLICLGSNYYSTICVSEDGNSILAFNSTIGELEKFNL